MGLSFRFGGSFRVGRRGVRVGVELLLDDAGDPGGRLEDRRQQLRKDGFAGRDVGDCLELVGIEDHVAQDADLHLRLLELLFEVLDGLGGGEDFALAGDECGLADEAFADVRQAGFGKRLAHVGVLGNVALGTGGTEAVAKLGELRHGHAGVIHHEHVGRSVHPVEQFVDDDFLVGIHGRGKG